MAEQLTEYVCDVPIPHTVLLSKADAERYGPNYRKKERAPQNKAATPLSK